jgi:hypothetical protein
MVFDGGNTLPKRPRSAGDIARKRAKKNRARRSRQATVLALGLLVLTSAAVGGIAVYRFDLLGGTGTSVAGKGTGSSTQSDAGDANNSDAKTGHANLASDQAGQSTAAAADTDTAALPDSQTNAEPTDANGAQPAERGGQAQADSGHTIDFFGMEVDPNAPPREVPESDTASLDAPDGSSNEALDVLFGSSSENEQQKRQWATELDSPTPVSFRGPDGEKVRGEVVSLDAEGFDLRDQTGQSRRIAWDQLEPGPVFFLHDDLLGSEAQAWIALGKRLALEHNSVRYAKKAFREAVKIDPSLASTIKERWAKWQKQVDGAQ